MKHRIAFNSKLSCRENLIGTKATVNFRRAAISQGRPLLAALRRFFNPENNGGIWIEVTLLPAPDSETWERLQGFNVSCILATLLLLWGESIMDAQSRTHVLNILIANVPDLAVCWVAARLTESGWSGFFITLVVLQTIYFFFWFKQAVWQWLLFWFYGKRRMAAAVPENSFIDSRFPPPSEFVIVDSRRLSKRKSPTTRGSTPPPALELPTNSAPSTDFKIARRFSMILQLNSAAEIPLKRYARPADRFAQ